MVAWLLGFILKHRSQLIAMVGVLAVCGVGVASVAYVRIRLQDAHIAEQERAITKLTEVNRIHAENAAKERKLREAERHITLALQEQIATIQTTGKIQERQLEQLRQSNEKIRDYMSKPVPDDLRRLLEGK